MEFKNMLFAFILTALFGMLLLTAVVNVGTTYNVSTSEVVGGSLSLDKFNDSISSLETNAKELQAQFERQSIWSSVVGIVVEGFFGIAKDIFQLMLLPFDIVSDILSDVLGVPSFVTSIILGLFIFGVMFAIWKLLKIGE